MKNSPRVYLVSRPVVDWVQIAAFLSDEELPPVPESIRAGEDESNAIIEVSARLCYMSFGRGPARHRRLYPQPAEVEGRLGLRARQLRVRLHGRVPESDPRAGEAQGRFAYSQRSQRYVDEAEGSFVLPLALRGEGNGADEARRVFDEAMESAGATLAFGSMLHNRPFSSSLRGWLSYGAIGRAQRFTPFRCIATMQALRTFRYSSTRYIHRTFN